MVQTMKLGQEISVTPIITAGVEKLQIKGAGALAKLVPLDGKSFERAYLTAMIAGHTEALAMIDDRLLESVDNDALEKHLTATRGHIAKHLEKAKALQAGARG